MYGLQTMDIVYLVMLWVVLQVLIIAFDMEGNISVLCKIIFPLAIVGIIVAIMIYPFMIFGR